MIIDRNIAVIGGGVAGLALARALAQRGAKTTVYEQAPEILEVGAGLQVSPNGICVLRALGLAPENYGMRSNGARLMDGYLGKQVLDLDFATHRPDAEFLLMHRADLIEMLDIGAREVGVDIQLDHQVKRIGEDADGVTVVFENGSENRHDIVIGADGLHSKLRPMLNGPAEPFFTGQTAWRATVPALGGEEHVAMVHMAAGRHVVTYPLRNSSLINIVAIEERSGWSEEGWFHTGNPDDLMRNFSNFSHGVRSLLSRVESVSRWGLFRHPVAENWHSKRTALVGDAAHPTLPFMAQGAVMAFEDIWVLSECLANLPLDRALPAYQAKRRDRTVRVIEAANANARNYHHKGAARVLGHSALRLAGKIAPKVAVDRYAWLYDYDVTKPG